MKTYIKKIDIKIVSMLVLVFICILMENFVGYYSYAYDKLPQKVRIGIFFDEASKGLKSAVSTLTVSAEKGIVLGYCKSGIFTELYYHTPNEPITIRKDKYYIKTDNKFTEYTYDSNVIPLVEAYGPYHIKIGENYNDFASANKAILDLAEKGIDAYPAYIDGWQVWTGFYNDEKSCWNDVNNNLNKVIDATKCKAIGESSTRIACISKYGTCLLMFDGYENSAFQIHPNDNNNPYLLKLNGDNKQRYRGDIEVRRLTKSDMTVINIVPLEQYIYGIVSCEIGASASFEALKAQAIAARTYALTGMGNYPKLYFDLCNTIYSQVYGGVYAETAKCNKAVDETAGKIVTYNGKPACIFYYDSSGGVTEDIANVWGSSVPYLKSVDDGYDSIYTWKVTLAKDKIKQIFDSRGFNLGNILDIAITKTSSSGRTTELLVTGSNNQRVYKLESCRTVFGFKSQWYTIKTDADVTIKSRECMVKNSRLINKKIVCSSGTGMVNSSLSNYTILAANGQKTSMPITPNNYYFSGKGYGHGIGMSQAGANGMAVAGYTCEEILQHYFVGTKVE